MPTPAAAASLDHVGSERAVVSGWLLGVRMRYEPAHRHPERVAGLGAAAGVPGDTCASRHRHRLDPRPRLG